MKKCSIFLLITTLFIRIHGMELFQTHNHSLFVPIELAWYAAKFMTFSNCNIFRKVTKVAYQYIKPETVLCNSSFMANQLSPQQHGQALMRYAQKCDDVKFEHIANHEKPRNRDRRIEILRIFGYPSSSSSILNCNMLAYRGIGARESTDYFTKAINLLHLTAMEICLLNYKDIGIQPIDPWCGSPLMYIMFQATANTIRTTPNPLRAIALLLKYAPSTIHQKNRNDQTALHIASMSRSTYGIANILIKHGAQVNAKDMANKTPLHYALENPIKMKMARLLVDNGALINIKTKRRQIPLLLLLPEQYSRTLIKRRKNYLENVALKIAQEGSLKRKRSENNRKNEQPPRKRARTKRES